ncbi:MAG: pyridoxal phosphate-dependent aminotransferase [Prolixibacteraceae bacterium]|nr:pyridoxal phosphate-dependent aminotransferase [Prolixibacteraceae bacterium]
MTILKPNSRMIRIPISGGIREIRTLSEKLEAGGKKILHFEIGEPNFPSPEYAKKAAVEALYKGYEHYCDNSGVAELRNSIAENVYDEYGYTVDPENELIVTLGATEAIMMTLLSLFEFGDEIILLSPIYPAYADQIIMAGLTYKIIHGKFENNFLISPSEIESNISNKTKGIIINSPSNPTGVAMSKEYLNEIANLAHKHNLIVISDECYKNLIFEGKHYSISSLPGMRERCVVVSAASKTFSMTGWRIGWAVIPKEYKTYGQKAHALLTTHATTFCQYGVAKAIRESKKNPLTNLNKLKHRRDIFVSGLSKIKGIEIIPPHGGLFVYPHFIGVNNSSVEICTYLLYEAGIATVPGETFRSKDCCLRFSLGCSTEEIYECLEKLASAVKQFS